MKIADTSWCVTFLNPLLKANPLILDNTPWDRLLNKRAEVGEFTMFIKGYAEGLTLDKYYALEIADLAFNGKHVTFSVNALDQIQDAVHAGVNLYCDSEKSQSITSKAREKLGASINQWYTLYLFLVRAMMRQNGVAA